MNKEWNKYFWDNDPNKAMKNKLNIKDSVKLRKAEYLLTSKIEEKLYRNFELSGNTIEDMKNIHKQLLGSIYEWAGEFRDVNMSKGGHSFLDKSLIESNLKKVDDKINQFRSFDKSDSVYNDLADIHNNINEIHAFREGNGRTQKFMINALAKEKGLNINFDRDVTTYLEAARTNDVKLMAKVMEKGSTKIKPEKRKFSIGSLKDEQKKIDSIKPTNNKLKQDKKIK